MKKRLKAVYTIEAAVVVPIIMVIVALLVEFGLYLHDCVLAETVGPAIVLEAAGEESDGQISEMLNKRLAGAGNVAVNIESSEDIVIDVSAEFNWPFRAIAGGESEIKTQVNISNLDGRKKLLGYKILCDGIGKLTEGKDDGD